MYGCACVRVYKTTLYIPKRNGQISWVISIDIIAWGREWKEHQTKKKNQKADIKNFIKI